MICMWFLKFVYFLSNIEIHTVQSGPIGVFIFIAKVSDYRAVWQSIPTQKFYTVFKLKIAATRQVWYGLTDADWHTDITILTLQKGKIGPWTTSLTWTALPSKKTRLSKVISITSPWNKCVNCPAFKQTWIPFAQKYFCVKFDSCQSFFFKKVTKVLSQI